MSEKWPILGGPDHGKKVAHDRGRLFMPHHGFVAEYVLEGTDGHCHWRFVPPTTLTR